MSKNIRKIVRSVLCLMACTTALKAQQISPLPLIPYPQNITVGAGHFTVNSKTVIVVTDSRFRSEAGFLNAFLEKGVGKPLRFAASKSNFIMLVADKSISNEEGYRLNITATGITLTAKTPTGLFRGIETIRQLLPAESERPGALKPGPVSLPLLNIVDQPGYSWRGMHLDVSRHFFSTGFLKKYIDLLALYKFNKLHLHLTDDQGWRIEIKKYPKLTEEGAWRTFNDQDSICMAQSKENPDMAIDPKHIVHRNGKTLYGGFYTQAQMKEIVAYAAKRHVDIIPEIDMPGHMMAAINSYPFLSCTGGSQWGKLFTTPICPCNESTFEFAENVFKEIFEIFPSQYIHIGGDEVERSSWATSEACKALMQKEGIATTGALQSYFINRMEKFFNKNGRKLIGWDEILEDGISSTAVVMYWRSWVPDAPVKAAKNGNKVIMTPGSPLYFDNIPDRSSINNIYHFSVVPSKLNDAEAKNIIGAQANLWSERIPSEDRAEFMVFPRANALSERLWTNDTSLYPSFLKRLNLDLKRLDNLKVHYRLPDLEGIVAENVFVDKDTLVVTKPLPNMVIKYTTDGSLPSASSKELTGPLVINEPQVIKITAFNKNGSVGEQYTLNYKKQMFANAVTPEKVNDGLACNYYKAEFQNTTYMNAAKTDSSFIARGITVPSTVTAPVFGLSYRGYIRVPSEGIYTFYLTCDDGGVLKIADREVVNNDGQHSAVEKNGQIALRKGLHPFVLDFIEAGGGYTLKLLYSFNGSAPVDIPASWFKN